MIEEVFRVVRVLDSLSNALTVAKQDIRKKAAEEEILKHGLLVSTNSTILERMLKVNH